MIEWQWSSFADLTAAQLYEMLALRQQVFVLEQTCLYPDIDGLDPGAHHLLGWRISTASASSSPPCAAWRRARNTGRCRSGAW
jgi:predicted GNAT family N-acyltransferase